MKFETFISENVKNLKTVLNDVQNEILNPKERLKTSITSLDNFFGGGFESGTNIIIGARPAMGKTTLATILALDLIKMNENVLVLYWNWEMTAIQQGFRILSRESLTPVQQLKSKNYEKDSILNIISNLKNAKILDKFYIIDSSCTSSMLAKTILSVKDKYKNHTIVNLIDHSRLVQKETANTKEEEKLTDLCNNLNIVKKKGCLNILLSQLNRNVLNDFSKTGVYREPNDSDLFGADSLSQFADITMLLHRPSVLNIKSYKSKDVLYKSELPNLMFVEIVKSREGSIGQIPLYCDLSKNIITDYNHQKQL